MLRNNIRLILLLISLFGVVILFVPTGFVPATTLDNQVFEKQDLENPQSSDISTITFETYTEGNKLNFSGEVLTCTNISDVEQVIDLRLTSFDVTTKFIFIHPLNITIDLLPEQIKRIDLPIPYGISTIDLVSSDGGELKVQLPACVNGYEGSTASFVTQLPIPLSTSTPITTTPTPTPTPGIEEIPEFPSIGLPIVAVMAMLFIMKKRK